MDDWTDIVKPEMLNRRITLGEYFVDSVEAIQKGHISQAAVHLDRVQLENRAQPNDEWWEWIIGTEPLMQMGGLALVRDNQIIWARNDWIS